MSRPAVDAPEPVLFDFRAPPQAAPALRTALDAVQARFAIALRALLTPRLREVADAGVVGADLLQAAQYEAHCRSGVRFLVPLGASTPADAVLQFGPELAAHCVDRIFGGTAESAEDGRQLTGLERSVLTEFVDRMMPLLRDAVAELVPIAPARAQFVMTPEAPTIAASGQTVVLLRFELRCGALTGPLDIAFPLALVEAPSGADAGAVEGDVKSRVEGQLRLAHVTITTRIGFRASALDVASMQPGTVLATGHPSHADVEIAVNGRRVFTGILGRHLGHVGVRVLREAAEESTTPRSTRRISPS